MEFIGLLGLIGLIGFFASRGLGQKFDKLKNEMRRQDSGNVEVEARIAGNEKIISEIKAEISKINSAPENFPTRSELETLSKQVDFNLTEFEKNFVTQEKFAELEKKIPTTEDLKNIQDALKNFQNKIDEQTKIISDFESRIKKLETAPPVAQTPQQNNFEQRIVALETDRKNLLVKISEQNSILAQYQNFISQTQNNFNNLQQKIEHQTNNFSNLQNKIDEQTKIISDFELRIKKLETKKAEPVPTQKISTPVQQPTVAPLKISDFQIKTFNKPLFTNNAKDAEKVLAIVENLSEINSFLEKSNFNQKDNFIRLVKNYQQNLQKFSDKVRRGKFDEDIFSEEVTDAFFDVLQKYFLATLPVSILRGSRENPKFYSAFLECLNKYLVACNVYTELVEPKKFMKSDDIEKMTIIKKDTATPSEDKFINEVERLPYFINYLTEDDELEKFCYEGKMVVLKFDGGKK